MRIFPRALGPVAVLAASAILGACASSQAAAPRGGFLTVAELRAKSVQDTVQAPAPSAVADTPAAAAMPPRPRPVEVRIASAGAGDASPAPTRGRPAAVTQGRWIKVDGSQPNFPFVLHNAPLPDVLSTLAEEVRWNIVPEANEAVRGVLLTAEVRDLPWHLGLEAVLDAHRLRAIQTGPKVLKIVTKDLAEQDLRMEPVSLRFLTAGDVEKALGDLMMRPDSMATVSFIGDPEFTRQLVLKGSEEQIAQIRDLLRKIDRRPPNITLQTEIVTVDRAQMRKTGIAYSFGQMTDSTSGMQVPGMNVRAVPRGGVSSEFGPAVSIVERIFGRSTLTLNAFVDATVGHGLAESQTTPMITTLSDQPAKIRVGDSFILPNNQPIFAGGGFLPVGGQGQQGQGQQGQPGGYGDGQGGLMPGGGAPGITPNYGMQAGGFTRFQTGTTLNVTAYSLGDGLIRVKLFLERDGGTLSPSGESIQGANQEVINDVIVPDGTPIVIAGLSHSAKSSGRNGVPLLSNLPLVGALFRVDEASQKFTDTIVILTPRINQDSYEATYGSSY